MKSSTFRMHWQLTLQNFHKLAFLLCKCFMQHLTSSYLIAQLLLEWVQHDSVKTSSLWEFYFFFHQSFFSCDVVQDPLEEIVKKRVLRGTKSCTEIREEIKVYYLIWKKEAVLKKFKEQQLPLIKYRLREKICLCLSEMLK